ncbi:hypothetical protein [Mucilaginibacter sp.]|uniref:hypothetical protein n=1 Tax=Mucilaginibacter sp. TaxID=1882438 RepID=UPI0025FD3DBD|nr:hypothetical protein [Mucilaginibacter sp.]
MKTTIQSNSYLIEHDITVATNLRTLYYLRSAFSVIWAVLISIFAKNNASVAIGLLILYPAWDVVGTLIDIKVSNNVENSKTQYFNAIISAITTIAVAIALQNGVPEALIVFGAWAILTGLIQLIMAVRRKKKVAGQWPMIISGGQSMIGGSSFIILAHLPTMGIASLAGYAAFGAFYYLLSAIRLNKVRSRG